MLKQDKLKRMIIECAQTCNGKALQISGIRKARKTLDSRKVLDKSI